MMNADQEAKLQRLMEIFLEENAKLNLSALRTPERCWPGNILDSLPLLDLPLASQIRTALDIGTGGGFPLLPLAVTLPHVKFTGLDSTKKKIDAVQRITEQMGLQNVELVCDRAEVLGNHPRYREQFDIVTARAVAEISVLLEYSSVFVRESGYVILWKSMEVDQELEESKKAQKELRCVLSSTHVYELPGELGKRQLLLFKKMGKSPKEFPREVGFAKKKPIA